jgi:OOP family OmpA-OmpF porin
MRYIMKKLVLIAALAGIGFTAQADEGTYIGVGVGHAIQKLDNHSVNLKPLLKDKSTNAFEKMVIDNMTIDNANITGDKAKGKFGGKIYVGYEFNQHFALEAGYNYLNKAKITNNGKVKAGARILGISVSDSVPYKSEISLQGHVFSLAAKGTVPVTEDFALFGKLGAALYHARSNTQFQFDKEAVMLEKYRAYNDTSKKTVGTPIFGIGAEYKIDKSLALRAEYENFGKPKGFKSDALKSEVKLKRLDMFSISLRNSFN